MTSITYVQFEEARLRAYDVHQLPLVSRKLRVIADTAISWFFCRDIAEMGYAELAHRRVR